MNTPINHLTAGFIGLGLIGGSIARGLKRSAPDIQIMAYMRTREKLEQAHADGIVDLILDGVDEHLSECDIIFLCTPVEFNESYLRQIRPFLKEGAVVTDVGSTKTSIHETVAALGMESCFVGGHPMAGSEKTGYESSTDHLLENAYYIITPTPTVWWRWQRRSVRCPWCWITIVMISLSRRSAICRTSSPPAWSTWYTTATARIR
mgnify:CR=1 FL=1